VGQNDGAANHLIGVARVHAETEMGLYAGVETDIAGLANKLGALSG
jgi:hypothetical protein